MQVLRLSLCRNVFQSDQQLIFEAHIHKEKQTKKVAECSPEQMSTSFESVCDRFTLNTKCYPEEVT